MIISYFNCSLPFWDILYMLPEIAFEYVGSMPTLSHMLLLILFNKSFCVYCTSRLGMLREKIRFLFLHPLSDLSSTVGVLLDQNY